MTSPLAQLETQLVQTQYLYQLLRHQNYRYSQAHPVEYSIHVCMAVTDRKLTLFLSPFGPLICTSHTCTCSCNSVVEHPRMLKVGL